MTSDARITPGMNLAAQGTERHDIPPDAAGTLEGLRSAGYTTLTAVADLVDNALTGGAHRVEVQLLQVQGRWVLEVSDDGLGMSRPVLVEAMRVSSRSTAPRAGHDLGRYGIGMKAAALHLSGSGAMEVDTRTTAGEGGRTGWAVEEGRRGGWTIEVSPPLRTTHGTGVRVLDPLIADVDPSGELARIWQHLSLVFAVQVSHGLHLSVQRRPVLPVDVLGEHMEGTRHLGPWLLDGGRVTVRGYILPPADPEGVVPGWLPDRAALSGLHLRRGGRAITLGGWEGLARRGHPPSDRVRLLVCIQPEDGDRWGVDLTKSRMTIPADLRGRLREIVSEVTARAQRARGLRTSPSRPALALQAGTGAIWNGNGCIDRGHPAVQSALQTGGDTVEELLKLLERERQ